MATTIDSLQIEIGSSSKAASQGLNALKTTLEKLKKATSGGLGLNGVLTQLTGLNNAAKSTGSGVDALAKSLNALGSATKGLKISSSVANQIKEITAAANSMSGANLTGIRQLGSALNDLNAVSNVKLSSSIARQLVDIGAAVELLHGVDFGGISGLVTGLGALGDLRKTNLDGYIKQLSKIPTVMKDLADVDMDKFAGEIQRVAAALQPLASQMERVGSGFAAFPSKVKKYTNSVLQIPTANKMAAGSFTNFAAKLGLTGISLRTVSMWVARWITESNGYVENLNLFNVAMGEYADQAKAYADKVAEVVGIDPSAWMRNQGIFMTLADGFGVVGDRAYIMSKNLTQLGYDISSFFNIPIEESMQKLESGISGEIEPLRRLGYDLSQTKLQAIAASLGIQKSVSKMNQAEKAQLRYYAIMTQVTNAQGDMARTMNSPANQIRILSANVTQAARALGNIFIPAMNAILPVATALMQAIRGVAVSVASLFGYSLPSVEFSATTAGANATSSALGNMANNANNASGAAKKLKSILMGFDEINQLPDLSGGGGGSGGGSGASGSLSGFEFEVPDYDFLANAVSSNVDKIFKKIKPVTDWIIDHFNQITTIAAAIGGGLLSWKIASTLMPDLKKAFDFMGRIRGIVGFLAVNAINVALTYKFANDFVESGDPVQLVADGLTTLFSTGISYLIGNKVVPGGGVYAASVSMVVSAMTDIAAIYNGVSKEGVTWKLLPLSLLAVVKTALAGGAVGFELGGPGGLFVGAAIGAIASVAIQFAVILNGIRENDIANKIRWGTLHATEKEIERIAQQQFGTVDVLATVNLTGDAISGLDEARATLEASIANLNTTLNTIYLSTELNQNDLATWKAQAETMVFDLQNFMGEARNVVAVSLSIVPTTASDGTDLSGTILNAVTTASAITEEAISRRGAELGNLLAKGIKDGFTAEERALATELTQSLSRIAAAAKSGQATGQFTAGVSLTLSDLDQESYYSAIEKISEMAQEYRTSLEGIKKEEYAATQALLTTYQRGVIEGIYTPEEEKEVRAQIEVLSNTLADMSANMASDIDREYEAAMAPVREKVLQSAMDIFGGVLADANIASAPRLAIFGGKDPLIDLVENGTYDSLEDFANAEVEGVLGSVGKETIAALNKVGLNVLDVLSPDDAAALFTRWANAFGEDSAIEEFRKLGHEIVVVSDETKQQIADGFALDDDNGATDFIRSIREAYGEQLENANVSFFNEAWINDMDDVIARLGKDKALDSLMKNFDSIISNDLKNALGEQFFEIEPGIAENGIKEWELLADEVKFRVYSTLAAAFGDEAIQQKFEELGYSLPVAINEGIESSESVTIIPTVDANTSDMTDEVPQMVLEGEYITIVPTVDNTGAIDMMDEIANSFTDAGWSQMGMKAGRDLRNGLRSIRLPAFRIDWATSTRQFTFNGQTQSISIPIPNLKLYAGGGYPKHGELFVANEAGAEMVGRIGNKTAVANERQIGDAIFQYMDAHDRGDDGMDEERMAAAIVGAMRAAGLGTINIDGRTLVQAINRVSRQTGQPAIR